jgi:hypothetical protein
MIRSLNFPIGDLPVATRTVSKQADSGSPRQRFCSDPTFASTRYYV